jgi:hypothetical protein
MWTCMSQRPGDEETAVGVDDAALGYGGGIGGGDGNDAIGLKDDGLIGDFFACSYVDDGDVRDRSCFLRGRLRCQPTIGG